MFGYCRRSRPLGQARICSTKNLLKKKKTDKNSNKQRKKERKERVKRVLPFVAPFTPNPSHHHYFCPTNNFGRATSVYC